MRTLLILFVFIAFGLVLVASVAGVRVGPDEAGVRRIGFGPGQGLGTRALQPGFHWAMPILNYSTVSTIPVATQVLHFHRDVPVGEASLEASGLPSVAGDWGKIDRSLLRPFTVKTRDGAQVICDVSLLVRFYPERGVGELISQQSFEHGGPVDLVQRLGSEPERWVARIREAAGDAILRSLVSLSREEFYDFEKRMARIDEATDIMTEALAPFGIGIEAVLLRRYSYEADQIDEAIFLKNLQEQEEQLNATLVQLEVQKKRLAELVAEYDARIKTTLVAAESESNVIRAEGDKLYALKVAEGDLALASGQAEGDRLKARALVSAEGADAYIVRELAPLVSALQGGIVTDIDPFDLDAWVQKLQGEQ